MGAVSSTPVGGESGGTSLRKKGGDTRDAAPGDAPALLTAAATCKTPSARPTTGGSGWRLAAVIRAARAGGSRPGSDIVDADRAAAWLRGGEGGSAAAPSPATVSTSMPAPAPPPTLTWAAHWATQGGREPGYHHGRDDAPSSKPNQDSFIVEDAWWCPGALGLVAPQQPPATASSPASKHHGGGHRRSLSAFAGTSAVALAPPPSMAPNPLALAAAFDGHGPRGHAASDLARRRLPPALAAALARGLAPGPALASALVSVDADLMAGPCRLCGVTGTTAVAALLTARPPALHLAWVGDSRAVLARRREVAVAQEGADGGRWSLGVGGISPRPPAAAAAVAPGPPQPSSTTAAAWAAAPAGLTAIDLTHDHKPSTPSERARIEAAGGRVARLVDPDTGAEVGPARVWLATAWAPGLAMSRSLGDALARTVGVLPAADTATVDVRASDAFAIIATDGVWEFMDGQEAVDCVAAAPTPATGCAALVAEARRRWGVEEVGGAIDDITAIVLCLDVSAASGSRGDGGGVGGSLDRAGSS